jgi:hypothetical protein
MLATDASAGLAPEASGLAEGRLPRGRDPPRAELHSIFAGTGKLSMNVAFSPYIKGGRGHYDGGSNPRTPLPEVWLVPMDTSHLAENVGTAGTLFASVFVVATLSMRTMIPLRVFAILTNFVLIGTALPHHNYLVIFVQMVALALNSFRLHQMLQLVRDVKRSVSSNLSMEWLKPFLTERKCKTGEVLFYKDEKADSMYYIVSGRYRLVESGIELPVGAIVGEFGMFSPSNLRTQSLECIADGLILSVSYDQVEQLYVQNPAFGFYFLKLMSARLFENIDRLEQRLAQQTPPDIAAETA